MQRRLDYFRIQFIRSYIVSKFKPVIYAKWSYGKNWGDDLNEFLINSFSGAQVLYSDEIDKEKYLVIGSILNQADENSIVWGAGFISGDDRVIVHPKKICAVRGPLTREILLSQGVEAPEIYGDPALLLPRLYNPAIQKRYKIGIIPHYVDQGNKWLQKYADDKQVRILNIRESTLKFVRAVKSCEMIVSSSLHGIICADSYGIPAIWVKFSNNVIGDGFKFRDYFMSIRRSDVKSVLITDNITLDEIIRQHTPYTVNIDLDLLYNACPFRSRTIN